MRTVTAIRIAYCGDTILAILNMLYFRKLEGIWYYSFQI